MKARQLETKLPITPGTLCRALRRLMCFAAITLICSSSPAQNLFVSDGNGNIYEIDPNGVRSTFASGLGNPFALAFDTSGNLYEGDFGTGTIFKFAPDGTKSTFASGLGNPFALAFDRAGNLFVANVSSSKNGLPVGAIYKFTPDGVRTTFASGIFFSLAFDKAGNLFASKGDTDFYDFPINGSGKIYKLTPNGVRTTFASGLDLPTGLAFDSAGNLFVADVRNAVKDKSLSGATYKFTPTGAQTTFFSGFTGALAFDSAGNLFVSSGGNIYKFTPDGVRTTFVSGVSGFLAFQPRPAPLPAGPRSFANLSTRVRTELGNDVAIGGFIINGDAAKTVIVRACGPSVPVAGNLADPTLELHDGTGHMIATNDNWTSSRDNIMWSGLAPKNDHEAAIVATLSPGSYTTVVRGVSNTSGVALVEIFDLSGVTDSKLANISTRGKVETGDDMMIGGFVIGGDQPTRVLVRVIGPSLSGTGIADALPDSVLQLFNSSGTLIFENDDWRSAQADQIEATGLAPTDNGESAIVATLPPGSYTAVVRGKNDTTGVALVEIYNLETN